MNHELRTTDNWQLATGNYSTTVESALQISPFLTNKANFQKSQMNVTNFIKGDYDKMDTWSSGKNKANSNPIQTQSNPISPPLKAVERRYFLTELTNQAMIAEVNADENQAKLIESKL